MIFLRSFRWKTSISFSSVWVRDHISEFYRKMLSISALKIDSFMTVLHSFSVIMKKRVLAASPCGDPINDFKFRFRVLLLFVHHLVVGG